MAKVLDSLTLKDTTTGTSEEYEIQDRGARAQIAQQVAAHTDSDADYAAEVVDARVAADGTKYGSLGEHVRGEVSRLSGEIDKFRVALIQGNCAVPLFSYDRRTNKGIFNNLSGNLIVSFVKENVLKYRQMPPVELNFDDSISGVNLIIYDSEENTLKIIGYSSFSGLKESDYFVASYFYSQARKCFDFHSSMSIKEPPVKFSVLNYQAIGDSLTYGFIGFNTDGSQKRLEVPYPERVGELLGISTVLNEGETGTTVANDLKKKGSFYPMSNDKRVNNYKPYYITSIMGGTNDISKECQLGSLNDHDETTYFGGYQKIIEKLLTLKPKMFLFIIIPPITQKYESSLPFISAMKTISNYYGLPLLDMSSFGRLSTFNKEIYTVDGVHFTQSYVDEVFAPAVADFISTHYQ